jgi:hypothetical protein
MDAHPSKLIRRVVLVALALAFGTVTATALAHSSNDGSDDTTGTTQTTGTTTTPRPAFTLPAGHKVRLVGTVASRDETAGTFVLSWHKHHSRTRSATVRFERVPKVGRFVQVKGVVLDDATIDAARVKVLRGCRDDSRAGAARHGSDDHCMHPQGRGRDDVQADDHGGGGAVVGEDRGVQGHDVGDDHGGHGDEVGDDHGGHGDEVGDDHGGRGRGGDDD